jgi:hypothetical protein
LIGWTNKLDEKTVKTKERKDIEIKDKGKEEINCIAHHL